MYKQLFKYNKDGAYSRDGVSYDADHFLVSQCEQKLNDGWKLSVDDALKEAPKKPAPKKAKANDKKD